VAITEILEARGARALDRTRGLLVGGGVGVLVDADEAVEGNGQVCDADGLDHGQDYGALNVVAGGILAMGLGGADVEGGDVPGARADGKGESRQEGPAAGQLLHY